MLQRSLLLVLVLASGGPLYAQGQELPAPERYHLRAEYWWWWPDLGAEIRNGAGGTLSNVEDDLGVGNQRTFELRGTLRAGESHKLAGSYTQLDYDGDITEHATVRFGSQTFFSGTQILSSLKGGYYGAQYQYDFAKGPWGFFGGLAGARLLDLDVLVVAPAEARRDVQSLHVWRPVIGVSGRGYMGRYVSIAGSVAGLTVGSRGYCIEFDASLQIHIVNRVGLKAGYRSFRVKDDTEGSFLEFRDNGATVGIELSL